MLEEFVGPALLSGTSPDGGVSPLGAAGPSPPTSIRFRVLNEVYDSTHCHFLTATGQSCDQEHDPKYVGFQNVSKRYFASAWGNVLINGWHDFERELRELFEQHEISRVADIVLCSSPAVFCSIFEPWLERHQSGGAEGGNSPGGGGQKQQSGPQKLLLGYIGEPLLLGVDRPDHGWWFETFKRLFQRSDTFFAVYNPFLRHMIRYQTGLELALIRALGRYTEMQYHASTSSRVLVTKGPNICVDPVCSLHKLSFAIMAGSRATSPGRKYDFMGLDEFGSRKGSAATPDSGETDFRVSVGKIYSYIFPSEDMASELAESAKRGDEDPGTPLKRGPLSYRQMGSEFIATVMYPYDVSLMIFYELYHAGMPLFVPGAAYLRFFVFRGLHAYRNHHEVAPKGVFVEGQSADHAAEVPLSDYPIAPFLASLDTKQWFRGAVFWSKFTDFAQFPHLQRFNTVEELIRGLDVLDPYAVSAKMRQFSAKVFARSVSQWAGAVGGTVGEVLRARAAGGVATT